MKDAEDDYRRKPQNGSDAPAQNATAIPQDGEAGPRADDWSGTLDLVLRASEKLVVSDQRVRDAFSHAAAALLIAGSPARADADGGDADLVIARVAEVPQPSKAAASRFMLTSSLDGTSTHKGFPSTFARRVLTCP